ncbi:MAG TPA: OmpH family outer membrane protein [Polyangia bacterium]|nr:OmpH family outer membrane protein [Polyangia bacterium]
MTRSIFAFTIVFALVGGVARAAHADDKIAFVDLQRALEETKDGQAAKAKLKSDFDQKQKELDAKQDELKKMKEDFDKKSALMKEDAKQKMQQEMGMRLQQLQETYARLQGDLQKKEADATRGILAKLSNVVQKIAEREHFMLVLERSSSVVYGQPSLDITNEVIRTYNAGVGGKK